MTVDYMLPDIGGMEFIMKLEEIKRTPIMPIIIYSAKDFSPKEKMKIKQYASRILLKNVNSLELLLEETVMQLHLNHKDLLPEKQKIIENLRQREDVLAGKKLLIVDDDVRNLFALTTAFEKFNIQTITAESGQEAINILNENSSIDIVLMDIMMPEMDGYETTQKIRREHKNSNLPIIAVTAKAMKGDREKCIEAGASDYITKPVKIDQLLSLMRMWLYK
jgi:CheY-like chemotaxis protein